MLPAARAAWLGRSPLSWGPNGRVVALDVNPEMLAVGRILPATGAAIEWLEGDATELKLPDAAFDLVLSQQGLQFFPDRAAALQEMWRVLVAGGDVAVNVWRSLDLHPLHQALFEAVARRLDVPLDTLDIAFSLSNAEELRTLLHDAGFRNVRIIERSLEIRLPAPERFVHLTVLGAATSIPAFSQMDSTTRTELVEAVTRETEPIIRRPLRKTGWLPQRLVWPQGVPAHAKRLPRRGR